MSELSLLPVCKYILFCLFTMLTLSTGSLPTLCVSPRFLEPRLNRFQAELYDLSLLLLFRVPRYRGSGNFTSLRGRLSTVLILLELVVVLAINDKKNMPPPAGLAPLVRISFVVSLSHLTYVGPLHTYLGHRRLSRNGDGVRH